MHIKSIVCVVSSPSVSQLQPLQQLAVQVQKQSVCVKKKEKKLPGQVEVNIQLYAVLILIHASKIS